MVQNILFSLSPGHFRCPILKRIYMKRYINSQIFLVALFTVLWRTAVVAQDYQTQFAAVQFDRSRSVAEFRGGVAVDKGTGALNLQFPLGPGIGAHGVFFRPQLIGRISVNHSNQMLSDQPPNQGPILGGATLEDIKAYTLKGTASWFLTTTSTGSASLVPGSLNLAVSNDQGGQIRTEVAYPDGVASVEGGIVPSGVSTSTLLQDFGYTGWAVASLPYWTWNDGTPGPTQSPFLQIGSAKELLIGIFKPGEGDPVVYPYNSGLSRTWHLPKCILAIREGVAYEFTIANPDYEGISRPYPRTYNSLASSTELGPFPLRSAYYLLTRIRNRFGDAIVISYTTATGTTNGVDYLAKWYRGPETNESNYTGASIRLAYLGVTSYSGPITLLASNIAQTELSTIEITYTGTAAVPTYRLETFHVAGGQITNPVPIGSTCSEPWNGALGRLQPYRLSRMDATGSVSLAEFQYAQGNLAGIQMPGLAYTFQWSSYPFRRNDTRYAWDGYTGDGLDSSFLGISQMSRIAGGQDRSEIHERVVPLPMTSTPSEGWVIQDPVAWSSTTFYDAVHLPDGSVEVTLFVEPIQSSLGTPMSTDQKIQTMAHLKQMVREVRRYKSGDDWASDLNASAEQSIAYHVTRNSDWMLFKAGNPTGVVESGSEPYSGTTESFDKLTGASDREWISNWDDQSFMWTTTNHQWFLNGSMVASRPVVRTPDPSVAQWISHWDLGHVSEEHATPSDTLGDTYIASGSTTLGVPPVARTFNGDGMVTSIIRGSGSLLSKIEFKYKGESTGQILDRPLLDSALISNPGNPDPLDQDGIASYLYDSWGRVNAIRPQGVSWAFGQSQDALGRVESQSDPNGLSTQILWDESGRIEKITPPGGELATIIQYNPDQLGATLTRGNQVSEVRFNGFGEKILERRWTSDGKPSYRIFGYDAMERPTGESTWMAGLGDESQWSLPFLFNAWTETTPGYQTCKIWGVDVNGNAVCQQWISVPPQTTVHPAMYTDATWYERDPYGRVVKTTNPDGEVQDLLYGAGGNLLSYQMVRHPSDQATLVTTYWQDPLGRLSKVQDALGQETEYFYDQGDRLTRVRQWAGLANSGASMQERTWEYDPLGRLVALVKPESGRTEYGDFSALGRPKTAVYGAGTASPRAVRTVYQSPNRVQSIRSDDLSVDQDYQYDEAGRGNSLGKLTTDRSGSVTRQFSFANPAGHLTSLQTNAGGQLFTQAFSNYDGYGNRTQATVEGRAVTTNFDNSRGMPSAVSAQGSILASLFYGDTDWNLNQITYGTSGTAAFFTYDHDQVRLKSLIHSFKESDGSTRTPGWAYQYDGVGRMLTDGENSYTYDSLDRLKTAIVSRLDVASNISQFFDYDAFGNMISMVNSGAPTWIKSGFSLNSGDANLWGHNRLPENGSTGAHYDAQGNLDQIFTQYANPQASLSMTYDALGRVLSLGDAKRGTQERYQYTADGLRTVIEEWQGSSMLKRRYCIYNDLKQLVSEYELVLE